MDRVIKIIKETYESMGGFVSETGPKLVAAAIVVVAGLLIARVAKAGMYRLLRAIKFDDIAQKVGMSGALKRADVQQTSSDVVCTMVYWTLLIFTALATLGTMGIAGTKAMGAVIATIPSVVLATAILVLGINVSAFVAKVVQTAAVNAEIRQARLVRNVMHFGLSSLVVLLALKQFDIPSALLGTAFLIFFGGVCLSMALAFGLGSRDLAGTIAKATWQVETEQSKALSEASQLGNAVFPDGTSRRQPRSRSMAA